MSQVKPTTQTVLLWITKSLWNRWRSRPNMLISTQPSTVSELHCHGSTARSPCVQATRAEFPLTSLLHRPSSWPCHSNASCATFNISQIDTQIPSRPGFQSFLSSHVAMQKWCLVSYTSSLLYCLLYDIFPSNPPHCKPYELLKNPNFIVLFSVSSWAESPSPRKAFTMSGKSCFWNPLYSSRKRHTLPSALCFGQTEHVCFLQSFHIPFPNPLFYEVLYATLSQVSSFLSLLWP